MVDDAVGQFARDNSRAHRHEFERDGLVIGIANRKLQTANSKKEERLTANVT